ncbi:hypothetical protein GJV04_06425 [Enterobacteriaceae bacterium RIT714]|nr:hypothetical protein [Enterobacteriaceae bacterium RIT714]
MPAGEPLLAQAIGQPTEGDSVLPLDELAAEVSFEEILASALPEIPGEEAGLALPELADGDAGLGDLTPEDRTLADQQFMALLLNNPLSLPVAVAQEMAAATPSAPLASEAVSAAPVAPAAASPAAARNVTTAEVAQTGAPESKPAEDTAVSKVPQPVVIHKEELRGVMQVAHHTAQPPVISASQPQTQLSAPLRLDVSSQEMPQQLQHALGERLNIQVNNQIQHATIRLDPPDMGKIEISLYFEAGKLQVQINAGQSDVYRALQQVSNELRQSLTEQHFVDVDVQVLPQNTQQQQQGRHQQRQGDENTPVLANDNSPSSAPGPRNDASILMTI